MEENSERLRELEAENERLKSRLSWSRSEFHCRLVNAYQTIAAMLETISMEGGVVPAHVIVWCHQQFNVVPIIYNLMEAAPDYDAVTGHAQVGLQSLLDRLKTSSSHNPNVQKWDFIFSGEDVQLSEEAAHTLGMVVNILMAAPISDAACPARLHIRALPERVSLMGEHLAENYDLENLKSLRRSLLDDCVQRTLSGDIVYETQPDGKMRVIIVFPRSALNRKQNA